MTTNTAQIIPFNIESHQLRVIADERGEPWFVAADVCDVLGYKNSRKAIADHCRQGGVTKRYTIDNMGREQEVTIINEGNLYRLIIKCRLPVAERLEALVCDEILPAIRKTGRYEQPEQITPEQQNALQQIIKRIAAGDGKKTVALWSRFNNHFRLGSYKQLPSKNFAEAITYLEGLTGEYLPRPDLPNALHEIPTREQIFQEIIEESLGNLRLMVSVNKHQAMKVQHIAPNEIITTAAQIPDLIANCGAIIPNAILPKIIEAVASRMK